MMLNASTTGKNLHHAEVQDLLLTNPLGTIAGDVSRRISAVAGETVGLCFKALGLIRFPF